MDFAPEVVRERGYGYYTRISASALPPLFLAYAADPSDSGKIHAPVKQRWLAGDKEVIDGMAAIAGLVDEAVALATARPYTEAAARSAAEGEAVAHEWGSVFFRNFEGRRKLFSECARAAGGGREGGLRCDDHARSPCLVQRMPRWAATTCAWCTSPGSAGPAPSCRAAVAPLWV